jgi:transposase
MIVGPGNESDYRKASALTDGYRPLVAMADKGFDADWLVEELKSKSVTEVVIPPKENRKVKRAYNKEMYKGRNVVERAINKLKFYCRIVTRYDKTARNFYSFICLAAAVINYK